MAVVGVIQPESNAIGVSAARLSGESLTVVKGRLFKIHSTFTMKVCSDSSSRIRSRNNNCRTFFPDFMSASQAPLSKEKKEDWYHCTPLWHRQSWIFCWLQRMIPFQFTFSKDEVSAAVAVHFFRRTAAMDESACKGSVVCWYATFWQRSY